LTFIENPYRMFSKLWYDDITPGKEPEGYDFSVLKGMNVKVIVTNKSDPYRFDKFIEKLEQVGVLDMQIVEDHLNLGIAEDEEIVNEAESTIGLFKKYIDQVNSINLDKVKLEKTIVELYQEALSIE